MDAAAIGENIQGTGGQKAAQNDIAEDISANRKLERQLGEQTERDNKQTSRDKQNIGSSRG
jgi:hypothetical protein